MIDESVAPQPSRLPGKRYRFSVRALFGVTTLIAAGAAFVANYPAVALLALLLFLLMVFEIVFPLALKAAGERIGRSKYRMTLIVLLIGFVGGCFIWSLSQQLWPPHAGACIGALFGMVILVFVMYPNNQK